MGRTVRIDGWPGDCDACASRTRAISNRERSGQVDLGDYPRLAGRVDTVRFEKVLNPSEREIAQRWEKSARELRRPGGAKLFVRRATTADGFIYCVWEGSASEWTARRSALGELEGPVTEGPVYLSDSETLLAFAAYGPPVEVPVTIRRLDYAVDREDDPAAPYIARLLERLRFGGHCHVSDGGVAAGVTVRLPAGSPRLGGDLWRAEIVVYDKAREQKVRGPWWRAEFRFRGRAQLRSCYSFVGEVYGAISHLEAESVNVKAVIGGFSDEVDVPGSGDDSGDDRSGCEG